MCADRIEVKLDFVEAQHEHFLNFLKFENELFHKVTIYIANGQNDLLITSILVDKTVNFL